MSGHTQQIIERLLKGSATARELNELTDSLNYRARISDARKMGYDIRAETVIETNEKGEKVEYTVYTLVSAPTP